jgi:hypothetical protein
VLNREQAHKGFILYQVLHDRMKGGELLATDQTLFPSSCCAPWITTRPRRIVSVLEQLGHLLLLVQRYRECGFSSIGALTVTQCHQLSQLRQDWLCHSRSDQARLHHCCRSSAGCCHDEDAPCVPRERCSTHQPSASNSAPRDSQCLWSSLFHTR